MRNLIKNWFTPDDHGEIPAVVFLCAAFVFGSLLSMPWLFEIFR